MGACRDGICLEASTLIEEILPVARGLVHVGDSWFALSAYGLYTFREGDSFARQVRQAPPNLRVIEAATDRLYLGDESHWWSLRYDALDRFIDEGISALDAKHMDGALYWVDPNQIVYFRDDGSARAEAYCKLPAPTFEFGSLLLARMAPGAPAIFRRSGWGPIRADFVACPPPNRTNEGSADMSAELLNGTVIPLEGEPEGSIAGAYAGNLFWNQGSELIIADTTGTRKELFAIPSGESLVGPLVVAEASAVASASLLLSFSREFRGGLRLLALDGSGATRTLGMFGPPQALYIDEPSQRLCYADEYSRRIACLPIADVLATSG